ncbi:MAG TPA: hypothetical protein VN881_09200 [Candidatus Acidoferrales bacterium]|nr:hypothetical protein [Candidatus Acidoferrales bacterium]
MRLLPRLFFLLAIITLALFAFTAWSSQAQSTAQIPAEWNKALDSLADKIATVAKPAKTFSLSVKNISSLSGADIASLREELVAKLTALKCRITEKPSDAQLQISFSESAEDYVWVAEIRRGDAHEVVMVLAARNVAKKPSAAGPSIALKREEIWEQAGKILDFGLASDAVAGGGSILVILEPGKLSFYEYRSGEWELIRAVAVAHARPVQRDVWGWIDLPAGKAELADAECSGDFQHPETVTCTSAGGGPDVAFKTNPISMEGHTVDSYVDLAPACGIGPLILVSGPGDWTEHDFVQAFGPKNQAGVVSGKVQFPGPILALWPSEDGKSARVVLRNLQTGAYEASIVSVSCGD